MRDQTTVGCSNRLATCRRRSSNRCIITLRHEVASITVKTARAGLHPLFHQRFSTGMNKELPGQCNLILGWSLPCEGARATASLKAVGG